MVGVTGVLLWLLLFFAVISPLFAANGLANVLHYLATRRNAAAEASGRDPAR